MVTPRARRPGPAAFVLLLGLISLAPTAPTQAQAQAQAQATKPHYTWSVMPSKLWLRPYSSRPVRVAASSFCWDAPPVNGEGVSMCADGLPPERSEQRKVTGNRPLRMWFGRPGWRFKAEIASHRAPGLKSCRDHARARRTTPQLFVIERPAGPGIYQVHVFGDGPEGDLSATFTWRVGKWRTSTC